MKGDGWRSVWFWFLEIEQILVPDKLTGLAGFVTTTKKLRVTDGRQTNMIKLLQATFECEGTSRMDGVSV